MKIGFFIFLILVFTGVEAPMCQDETKEGTDEKAALAVKEDAPSMTVGEILDKVEKRYSGAGFSARFHQKSTIKALDITDTATGNVRIKRPGKMRWEYETPEKQLIVTDGTMLWVHRPEDNQVMVGKAPDYFGGGKGASFLSDMKILREKFSVSMGNKQEDFFHNLKLIPREKQYDIAAIHLSISKETFDISRISTINSYKDETLIYLTKIELNQNFNDSMFMFKIPKGADIVQLDE